MSMATIRLDSRRRLRLARRARKAGTTISQELRSAVDLYLSVSVTEQEELELQDKLLVLVGPWVALAGWPLFATRTRGNGPVRDLALRTTWRSAAIGVLFGVAGLVSALVVLSIQQSLTHEQPSARAADVAHIFVSTSPVVLALFALATAFGAPVVEELAFRGLTYGAFVNRGVAPVWSVLGTTVLFALFHFEPQRLLVLAVLGGWIGAVRAVTGSTTASMVAHMAINVPGAIGILLAH